ncbi:hypothetical protein [Mitsuaria sp. BK041]|uniref:hypothetical protein n=1 Tax=Mitsuaria sp. BK041 TaxID=2587123 RepID=UPI001617A62B
MLISASSSSEGSTRTLGRSGAIVIVSCMRLPSTVASSSFISPSVERRSTTCGCTGWRPATRSRCWVSRLPTSTERMIAPSGIASDSACGLRWIRWALLLMTPSRLLKSCATPPVSRPSAAVRCERELSCSASRVRSMASLTRSSSSERPCRIATLASASASATSSHSSMPVLGARTGSPARSSLAIALSAWIGPEMRRLIHSAPNMPTSTSSSAPMAIGCSAVRPPSPPMPLSRGTAVTTVQPCGDLVK